MKKRFSAQDAIIFSSNFVTLILSMAVNKHFQFALHNCCQEVLQYCSFIALNAFVDLLGR